MNGRASSGTESAGAGAVTHHKSKSAVKQGSELNLNQQGQSNTNVNIANSSASQVNSKSNIGNNANLNSDLLNLSPSHKSKSHKPLSLIQKSKININQTGQTNTGLNVTNSPQSNVNSNSKINNNAKVTSNINNPSSSSSHTAIRQKSNININQAGQTNAKSNINSKSSISNNANVNSKVNSNVDNPSKYVGSSSSSSPPLTQNSKTTVNQGAENNANINVNNSPGTHILNEQTIRQSVRVNNEVNNIIKNNEVNKVIQENTASSPQLTYIVTVKLAKSSMSSGALFPLADIAPYRVIGGHLTANLPSSSQQNIVVAQVSDNGKIEHAVILDLNQITGSNLNQNSLYETSLGSDISGTIGYPFGQINIRSCFLCQTRS
jgi:hypothetical protein